MTLGRDFRILIWIVGIAAVVTLVLVGGAEASYQIGFREEQSQNFSVALSRYNTAGVLNPFNSKILARKGYVLSRLERYNGALPVLLKASQKRLEDPIVWDELGWVYYRLLDDDKAGESFVKAINVAANYHQAYWHLGTLRFREGNYSTAYDLYSQALGLDPNNIAYLNSLGAAALALGNLETAEHWLVTALNIDGNFAKALNNLALVRLDQDRLDDALLDAKKAESLAPNSVFPMITLAEIYNKKGDKEQAIVYYKKYLLAVDRTNPIHKDSIAEAEAALKVLEGGQR